MIQLEFLCTRSRILQFTLKLPDACLSKTADPAQHNILNTTLLAQNRNHHSLILGHYRRPSNNNPEQNRKEKFRPAALFHNLLFGLSGRGSVAAHGTVELSAPALQTKHTPQTVNPKRAPRYSKLPERRLNFWLSC